MDPLSEMLSLLKVRSYMSGGFDAGGEWSLDFDRHDGIKFYAIISGRCSLTVDGISEPIHVKAGDCFLLPRGRRFCMASDTSLTPVDARAFLATARNGRINVYNGGGEFLSVCGHFSLEGDHAEILLDVLPPVVYIEKESDKALLRWCVDQTMGELREPQPGSSLVIEHLAHMMLVQALRLHLAEESRVGTGWLFALGDKEMGAAIKCVHEDPARRWTLQSLAQCAAMSRTAFALRFKKIVGTSPMEYLTRWRMLLAANKLSSTRESVSLISSSLGYESESAFSTAFKRVMGCSPREYSRTRQRASA